MAITDDDSLVAGLAGSKPFRFEKASVGNQTSGRFISLWRATGRPPQGAAPTTPAIPTKATLGAFPFANPTAPAKTYLTGLVGHCGNGGMMLELHDRVAHMGGLSLNTTTAQTITGFDVGPSFLNLGAARRGAADFSELEFWLEVYADGGATASNATIAARYDDNSTGNLSALAVGGTVRAGNLFPLTQQGIPAGRQLSGITGVTLSAATGAAGNFGFTVTRRLADLALGVAWAGNGLNWQDLCLPEIPDDACLALVMNGGSGNSGLLRGLAPYAQV